MRRLSIKGRVTLWYTLFLIALTGIIFVILFFIGDRQILASVQSRLEEAVSGSLDEIEYDDEEWNGVDIDDDLRIFQDGVYLTVYDEQETCIYGQLPHDLQEARIPGFENGKIQEVRLRSARWLIFDVYKPLYAERGVWVRGVLSQSEAESGLAVMLRLLMFFIPVFVLLAAIGGYYIIRQAFAPIEKIRKTVDEIADGNDLSRRIRLGDGSDEVYRLADTFDRMLERIQEAYEREKQFTADASHELRTPTSVIAAQAEYVLRHDTVSEEARGKLQIILEQSHKMSVLISQLLALARADRGQEKLHRENINLSELTEIIVEEERERAAGKQMEIYLDCQPGLYLEGDETMMMRCLINLLENAITYGREGGHIWVSLVGLDDTIQGYVRDDGIGVRAEDLPRIWERFYQADASRSSQAGSNAGLGLTMVKWIVEAHGGSITAESRYGQGTVFYFRLPKKDSAADEMKVGMAGEKKE